MYTHCFTIQMDASVSILSRGLHAWIWMGFLHRLGLHELYLFHPQP